MPTTVPVFWPLPPGRLVPPAAGIIRPVSGIARIVGSIAGIVVTPSGTVSVVRNRPRRTIARVVLRLIIAAVIINPGVAPWYFRDEVLCRFFHPHSVALFSATVSLSLFGKLPGGKSPSLTY